MAAQGRHPGSSPCARRRRRSPPMPMSVRPTPPTAVPPPAAPRIASLLPMSTAQSSLEGNGIIVEDDDVDDTDEPPTPLVHGGRIHLDIVSVMRLPAPPDDQRMWFAITEEASRSRYRPSAEQFVVIALLCDGRDPEAGLFLTHATS